MLALVLGFKEKGSTAPFEVLYAGRSASEAGAVADNPPPGIVRTETLKNPITHHRRHFPENLALIPAETEVDPETETETDPELLEAPAASGKRK